MSRIRGAVFLAVVLALAACSPAASTAPTLTGSPPLETPPPATSTPIAPSSPVSSSSGTSASPAHPFDPKAAKVTVTVAVTGLKDPLDIADAGDGSGRLFVVEQGGRIRIVRDGKLVDRPFLDIGGRITSGGERGLLGLAFHPNFPTDPRFFVDYTDRDGNTVVSSFRVSAGDPDVADAASESILLHVDQPFANHNGGGLGFGPDGDLYIALGDGGSEGDPQGNGQRLATLLGKILRIDVEGGSATGAPYAIPFDNPFVATAGARPEIWLYGLRNPWRFRFDRVTGDLWIGDVGQNAWEEIDVARRGVGGLDFGWNRMEGFHCYSPPTGCDEQGLTPPVAEYGHDQGCAVIGGVVVRHPADGSLDGGYLFGDDCSDHLWAIDPAGDGRREPVLLTNMGRSVSSIGEAEDGSVYATSLGNGELLRIAGGS